MAGWIDKRKVMQKYDATAEGYDELYVQEQKCKYGAALKSVNVAGKSVLDLGCGSGLFFNEVAANASIVLGVDISHMLLLKAQAHAEILENVFVLQADADHLPFANNSFDYIFSFTVLQNMPNPAQTLLETKRVCKEKGKVIVTALKKAFTVSAFMDLLDAADLTVVEFVDSQELKCYISVLLDSTCTSATSPVSA